ncbi:MAG TPA: DUF4124 domain-containing protein [Frateuria sp.]|uniref:DUF4124 domain-containing protein n=1 Tax=Frateuria sp. TaxID=2211372 RepID=UPI002D7ED86D|nr:DUF4124 domain-containing protein [Frateuria sp.]HET6805212.1 DUF4124 domain-containing protein [Frateuria sp.]
MPLLHSALLLLLALATPAAYAQAPIYHCIAADGHPVFTDQPCASLQATPAPASSATGGAPLLRPPAVTCAVDEDQLRDAVIDVFANQDANRLAGLMLWAGYGEHAVVSDIRGLADIMRRPLIGIDLAAGATMSELVVQTASEDGSEEDSETRFAIEPRAGCLWLRRE